jgi:hypothetical protein
LWAYSCIDFVGEFPEVTNPGVKSRGAQPHSGFHDAWLRVDAAPLSGLAACIRTQRAKAVSFVAAEMNVYGFALAHRD